MFQVVCGPIAKIFLKHASFSVLLILTSCHYYIFLKLFLYCFEKNILKEFYTFHFKPPLRLYRSNFDIVYLVEPHM